MAITSETPVTADPFDKWWIKSLIIIAPHPTQPVKVTAQLCRYNGTEIMGKTVTYNQADLFALAAGNMDVAITIDSLITAIGTLAKADGIIT